MDIKSKIKILINEALKNLEIEGANFSIEHPEDFKNGDYSTNVAMKYFGPIVKEKINKGGYMVVGQSLNEKEKFKDPKELAEKIKLELEKNLPREIEKVEVKNGFINFYLSKEFFQESIKEILKQKENWGRNQILAGKKVMVEYTQPNPFKPFHIGHLMSNAIGESISRIVEFSGAKTVRANYQGDIGPHVAKAIYHLIKLNYSTDNKLSDLALALAIGNSYAEGNHEYGINEEAKKEIDDINKQIYNYVNKSGECREEIIKYYEWGKEKTLNAFEELYKLLGTKFDYYFFESEVAGAGEKIVKENTGKVFEESDPEPEQARYGAGGAIIFRGEKYDPKLHTRVFINSKGLPTYETKELGLTMLKFEKENPDISIVTTAVEQAEYMKVVQKAIAIMHPEIESRMQHVTHGMMRLASGKMSSRKGNVITGESLLRDSMDVVFEKVKDRDLSEIEKKEISEIVGVSALKYSILRSSLGSDIIFDFEKSISFEGDSGPYLQYTAVRANSILNKAKEFDLKSGNEIPTEISNLEKLLYQFPEIVERSYTMLEPHHIATYLTELASAFNTFYGNTKILDENNEFINFHLDLIRSFYLTMQNGLWLLGIQTPEKM